MSRYRPMPEPITVEPTLENLKLIMKQINQDSEEIKLIEKLNYRLRNHPTGIVTSSEQLLIKSTIINVVGKQTTLSLALKASKITPDFNIAVSQEGVGDMLKTAVESLIAKVKQFIAWLSGLVKKVFSGNDKKAKECEEAARKVSDFKTASDKASEQAKENQRKENEFLYKQARDKETEKQREKKEYADRVDNLESTHTRIYQGNAGADLEFIIRRSAQYPFKTPAELKEFLDVVNKGLIPILSESVQVGKYNEGEPDRIFRKLTSDSKFNKFFDEVATSNDSITFKMKRTDSDGDELLRWKATDFSWMMLGCANTLRGLPSFIKRCESAHERLVIELRTRTQFVTEEQHEKNRPEIAAIREWLMINAAMTRLLTDVNRTIVHIADEALAAFRELVK